MPLIHTSSSFLHPADWTMDAMAAVLNLTEYDFILEWQSGELKRARIPEDS